MSGSNIAFTLHKDDDRICIKAAQFILQKMTWDVSALRRKLGKQERSTHRCKFQESRRVQVLRVHVIDCVSDSPMALYSIIF